MCEGRTEVRCVARIFPIIFRLFDDDVSRDFRASKYGPDTSSSTGGSSKTKNDVNAKSMALWVVLGSME